MRALLAARRGTPWLMARRDKFEVWEDRKGGGHEDFSNVRVPPRMGQTASLAAKSESETFGKHWVARIPVTWVRHVLQL